MREASVQLDNNNVHYIITHIHNIHTYIHHHHDVRAPCVRVRDRRACAMGYGPYSIQATSYNPTSCAKPLVGTRTATSTIEAHTKVSAESIHSGQSVNQHWAEQPDRSGGQAWDGQSIQLRHRRVRKEIGRPSGQVLT